VEVSQTTQLLAFATVSIGLKRRLSDRIVRVLQFPDKIRKTGRKRDAVADADFDAVADADFDVMARLRLHQVNNARIAFLKN